MQPPARQARPEGAPLPGEPGNPGPPPIAINWQVVDALCGVRCTLAEIAGALGVSEDTVESAVVREHGVKFREYFEQKATAGTIALRRKQFQLAMNGNVTMLIWLGKQHLGQMDQQRVKAEHTGAEGGPIEVNVNDVRQRIEGRIDSIAARLRAGADTIRSN